MSTFIIITFLAFYATLASIGAIKIIMYIRGRRVVDLAVGITFPLMSWILIQHELTAGIPAALGGDLSIVVTIVILSMIIAVTLYESLRDVEKYASRMD
jgi:hypothetical protein